MFVAFLYMFRTTMCPSSREKTVPMRHLVFIPPCIPDSHIYRVTNTSCRIGTVYAPGDGHIVARNMERKPINTLRKFVHQIGSIYKIIHGCMSTEHEKVLYNLSVFV